MVHSNPFKPTAGAEPPRIIGRDAVVMAFEQALREGIGSPARLMRISGPCGSGKTVLLSDLSEKAREAGWTAIDLTAGPYMMDDLRYGLESAPANTTFQAGINVGVASASATVEVPAKNLRQMMTSKAHSSQGLLITIDEVQDADLDDMRRIAQTVQHLIREKADIALVFAGLPIGIMDLINGKALTFLRRAMSEELGAISTIEIALSMADSFAATGLELSGDIQVEAAKATGGYAFMIQLVGYYVWQRANTHRASSTKVSERDMAEGIAIAQEQFHQLVHETAIAGISRGAMEYLIAMSEDNRVSATGEIARRMGKDARTAGTYRQQLIQRQVIQPVARGYVEFAVPYLGEYIAQNRDELMLRYGG